jgi:hypothetical protein
MSIDDKELEKMHREGWAPKELAVHFECAENTVMAHLKKLGLTHGQSGEQSPSFKGGEKLDGFGYVETLRPDHPRANIMGYVKRSVLMWEAFHGKPLERGWEIHHIDGDRQNDDPTNLLALLHVEHSKEHNKNRKRGEGGRFVKTGGGSE